MAIGSECTQGAETVAPLRLASSLAAEASRGSSGKKRSEERRAFVLVEQARCLGDQQGGHGSIRQRGSRGQWRPAPQDASGNRKQRETKQQ